MNNVIPITTAITRSKTPVPPVKLQMTATPMELARLLVISLENPKNKKMAVRVFNALYEYYRFKGGEFQIPVDCDVKAAIEKLNPTQIMQWFCDE